MYPKGCTKYYVRTVITFTLEKLEDEHLGHEWKSINKKWRVLRTIHQSRKDKDGKHLQQICNHDHVFSENYVTELDSGKVIDQESHKTGTLVRDAVQIKKRTTWIQMRGAAYEARSGTSYWHQKTEVSFDEYLSSEVETSINEYVFFFLV